MEGGRKVSVSFAFFSYHIFSFSFLLFFRLDHHMMTLTGADGEGGGDGGI